jgi:DNA-3-methyladenine glycosylase
MLNVVTEAPDFPAAVLIRAVEPVEGINLMQIHRPRVKKTVNLTNGPGKLCQALAIDQQLNNWDLTLGQKLWLESGRTLPDQAIATGPRIGIGYAHPEDQAALWRFRVKDNRFVST